MTLFAAGVALGLAVGAGAALLLAPQSGADARRALARGTRRMRTRGGHAWDDLRYQLRRAAKLGSRAARGAMHHHGVHAEADIEVDG